MVQKGEGIPKSGKFQSIKKTLNTGPKFQYQEVYNKFIDFIEFNRKLFNPITTWSLLLKLYEIVPNRNK